VKPGLGSITGGGAEIFDPILRDQICRGKETAAEWLDVHRIWHSMGGRSTCTMLYGHIETLAHRADHLRQLRQLQDETGGFTGFVPFAFEPTQSHGILADIKRASAFEQLRNLAVSRIYLDNIDHLTAYWVSLGLPLAQVSLSYGVDDLHGTILEEKIFHMAGATTPQQQTIAALEHAIREAGREPVQRDSHYRHISPRAIETHRRQRLQSLRARNTPSFRAKSRNPLCKRSDVLADPSTSLAPLRMTRFDLRIEIRPRRLR
jgi:aminodeoxyfutalosine synthase